MTATPAEPPTCAGHQQSQPRHRSVAHQPRPNRPSPAFRKDTT